MSHNSFGHLFRVTTWGESHGPAIGCVIDGCPPRIPLEESDIQPWLDKRRPGTSRHVSQRKEPDSVRILSGVFREQASGRQLTTGAPISLLIENADAREKDYDALKDVYRPGHADLTYDLKYGIRDHRGGGRASARETATRVAAGAVARKVINALFPAPCTIRGALIQIGTLAIDRTRWEWEELSRNAFWCPDPESVAPWAELLDSLRKTGSSCGGIVEITASGAPAGLGAPVYGKLDAELAGAIMSINAVKGVEIGAGFGAAALKGENAVDEIRNAPGRMAFQSNLAGGVLGGISTGQDIVVRFAVKPTPSLRSPQKTVTRDGKESEVSTTGRHDPCVAIRAVPVGEAMMALVLADHLLRHLGQGGDFAPKWPQK